MKITKLQQLYVQKSKLFLYSVLGIKRGINVTPIQTFVSWSGEYEITDFKLICTYHMRTDNDFKNFEKNILLNNEFFEDMIELENDTVAYVFDLSSEKEDYQKIINGSYSKLSAAYKKKVLKFFNDHKLHQIYIHSYLEPHRYRKEYSDLLAVNENVLKKVEELCDAPNLSLERLDIPKKKSNFDSKLFNNQQE